VNAEQRLEEIERRLQATFSPESLRVDDESHQHIGHEGAKDGRGHFRVTIVSDAFNGMNMISRHRAIYAAMGELMQTDIHALAIEAFSSDEF
jgi:BolA protein